MSRKLSEHEKVCVTCKNFYVREGAVKTNRCGATFRHFDSAHKERAAGLCVQLHNYEQKPVADKKDI